MGRSVIVLVDDSEHDRDFFHAAWATITDHPVLTFEDGTDFLAAVADGLRPRLVFLDVHMSGLGGEGVLEALLHRRKKSTDDVGHLDGLGFPVVVLTSDVNPAKATRMTVELGAATYIVKPSSLDDLERILTELHDAIVVRSVT